MARHLLWLVSALIFVGLVIFIDSNSTQAEIENAWNEIRTNEQVLKVLAYLGLRPLPSRGQHAQRCVIDTSASPGS